MSPALDGGAVVGRAPVESPRRLDTSRSGARVLLTSAGRRRVLCRDYGEDPGT
ncbi:hypothetical protein GCM10009769_27170 [Curtobacterium luteum]|uniref:Uncharacterized protein n=1 Tax=Curtobacterium luteum TaxID=33881 RepID=A0A8H9KZ23_9MICO|nr:hypothetical protein GCM10009769_27170 [Curtobacterium luteum]